MSSRVASVKWFGIRHPEDFSSADDAQVDDDDDVYVSWSLFCLLTEPVDLCTEKLNVSVDLLQNTTNCHLFSTGEILGNA